MSGLPFPPSFLGVRQVRRRLSFIDVGRGKLRVKAIHLLKVGGQFIKCKFDFTESDAIRSVFYREAIRLHLDDL